MAEVGSAGNIQKNKDFQAKGDGVTAYNPSIFTSLMYPSDLHSTDGSNTPDAVCFTIMKRIGMSIDDVSGAGGAAISMMAKAITAGFSDDLDEKTEKKMQSIWDKEGVDPETKRQKIEAIAKESFEANEKEMPENFYETIKGGLMLFGKKVGHAQDRVKKARAARKKLNVRTGGEDILGSIYMNMPAGITFNDKANWGGQELGMIGNTIKNVITGDGAMSTVAGGVAGASGNIAAAGVTGIGTLVAKMGLKGGLVGAAVGAAAAGSTIQRGGEAALGVSMNPYMEMMFSGVSFRDFQFDFTMRPRNEDEFQKIDKIIKMFRENSRPSWQGGKLGKSFMNYPMVYRIEFLTAVKSGSPSDTESESYVTNPNIPKLKTCVCDSVTTNYAPQNMWTAHQNGVPVAVTLGLHFQETELVMAQDVNEGGY